MTDKKDGQGPKDGSPKAGDRGSADASGAQSKRPFATIDLKAVEVPGSAARSGPVPPKPAEPKPKATGSGPQAETAAKVAAAATPASGSVPPAGAKSPTAETSRKPETMSAAPPPTSSPPPPQRASGGFGRLVTHTLAGVVGGALALVAAPHLQPQLTPLLKSVGMAPPPAALPPELVDRLARLEAAANRPAAGPSPDQARLQAAADANRTRIEELTRSLAALRATHDATAKAAGELQARITREPPIADAADRLVALERQLAEIAAAATAEPDRAGRIPQLAQLTGRIADLEAALTTRTGEVRKDMTREFEQRLVPATEASEAARAATQRLDRDLAGLKSENNRVATGLDQLRTSTERLEIGLKSTQDETSKLTASLDTVRREMETRLGATAKPADVAAAVAPVASQLAALEKNVTTVVRSETERNATAERIVLALELGNLKRAMDRGAPFVRELAEVRKVAGTRFDLAPLAKYADAGLPTLPELTLSFRPVANAILDAESQKGDGTVVDRLLSGAKSFVRVRKTTAAPDDTSPEAVVARIEAALKSGRLADVATEAKAVAAMPPAAADWFSKVAARNTVETALKSIDEALKASLGAGGAPPPAAQKKGQP